MNINSNILNLNSLINVKHRKNMPEQNNRPSFGASARGFVTHEKWGNVELIQSCANYIIKLIHLKPNAITPEQVCASKIGKLVTVQGQPTLEGNVSLLGTLIPSEILPGNVVLGRLSKGFKGKELHPGSNEILLPGDKFVMNNSKQKPAKIVEVITREMGDEPEFKCVLPNMKNRQIVEKVERPWGNYTTFCVGGKKQGVPTYWIKELYVNPEQGLSLQFHRNKIERYIVAEGEATVRCGADKDIYPVGAFINIPKNCVHRLENNTKKPVRIVEVTTGKILEDDIVRLSDRYGRTQQLK